MSAPRHGPARQRGVALVIALVLVALATLLAWKISFQGYLERRRTVGFVAAEQAMHFGFGAEALAADILASDLKQSKQDTLAEAWAQPTAALPIGSPSDPDGEPIGTLQGGLEDMQGRFNLNNLGHMIIGPDGKPEQDPQPLELFQRLLAAVGLETRWAGIARDWIDADGNPGNPDGAEDSVYTSQTPPYLTGNWPMTSPSELLALPGFGLDRYQKLAPYVTALPTATAKINLCTASAYLLDSLANKPGEFSTNLDALVVGRKSGCVPDKNTFNAIVGSAQQTALTAVIDDSSSYFLLTTHVVLGTSEFTLYSLLWRGNGGKVTPLLRTFGTY